MSFLLSTAVPKLGTAVFACSLVSGAEDPTAYNMAISGAYFCIALLLLVLQIPIFIYRGKKNTWIFWGTLVATVGFVPISLMGLVMGGTSCGEASIYIAKRVAAFYLIAFALQLLSWPFDHKAEAIQSLKH